MVTGAALTAPVQQIQLGATVAQHALEGVCVKTNHIAQVIPTKAGIATPAHVVHAPTLAQGKKPSKNPTVAVVVQVLRIG